MNAKKILMGAKRWGTRNSDKLCMVGGIGFMVGAIVSAVLDTRAHCEEIVEEHKNMMDSIRQCKELCKENPEYTYTKLDEVKDTAIFCIRTGFRFAIAYARTFICTAASITCFGAMYKILSGRAAAAISTLGAYVTQVMEYRGRVAEKVGSEKEQALWDGERSEKIEVVELGENGEMTSKTEKCACQDGKISPFAFWFDESFRAYSKSAEYNVQYIKGIEGNLEEKLQSWGYITLNDIRDEFKLPRIAEGQHFGIDSDHGNNHVDLGITKELWRLRDGDSYRSPAFLINPNIDMSRYIWEKMPEKAVVSQ